MPCRVLWVWMVFSVLAGAARASELGDLVGLWRDTRYGALVDIGDCGDASPCGRLAQVDRRFTQGQTQDVRNRDAALRGRDLIGLPVLWGFTRRPDGWRDGQLYNPDDGKSFRAQLRLVSATELRVTGCLGPLCLSEIWTRAVKDTDSALRSAP